MHRLRWEQRPGGARVVELRCRECLVVTQARHSTQEMQEMDRRLRASRDELVAAYERAVTENMEAMATCLREALARDLVGADDFAPRRARRTCGPCSLPRAA